MFTLIILNLNEFDFTIYISLFCVIRSRWCYWFCNLEPKLTPRTFLFCPLGYLWLSSVLHLDTLVWVELFRQINWTPRMCTWMHGCFLCLCGFGVFVIFFVFLWLFFFWFFYRSCQFCIYMSQVRWEDKKLGIAYAISLLLAPAYIIFKIYEV